jgi:hypothetical protein
VIRLAISKAALVRRDLIFLDRARDGGLFVRASSMMPTNLAGVPLMRYTDQKRHAVVVVV